MAALLLPGQATEMVDEYEHVIGQTQKSNAAVVADLSRLIAKYPQYLDPYITRARLYLEQKQYSHALSDYKTLFKLQPTQPVWLFEQGLCLQQLERRQEALDCFSCAYDRGLKNIDVARAAGGCVMQMGRMPESIMWWERALALAPGNKYVLIDHGYALAQLKRQQAAVKSFCLAREAIFEDLAKRPDSVPENIILLCRVARELIAAKAIDEAASLISVMLTKYPSAHAYFAAGELEYAKGEYRRSKVLQSKCIELAPEMSDAFFDRSVCESKLGEWEAAVTDAEKASRLGYAPPEPEALKIRCLLRLKKIEQALQCARALADAGFFVGYLLSVDCLLASESRNPEKLSLINQYLARAESLKAPRQKIIQRRVAVYHEFYAGAAYLNALNELIRNNGGCWEPYAVRGMYFSVNKRIAEGLADMTRAIELGCSDPAVFIQRSKVFEDQLLGEKALEDAQRAIKLSPNSPAGYKQRAHVYKYLLDQPELAMKDEQRYKALQNK